MKNIEQKIMRIFERGTNKILSRKRLLKKIKKVSEKEFDEALKFLESKGMIYLLKDSRIAYTGDSKIIKGKVEKFREGYAFVLVDDGKDVFLPPPEAEKIINGDVVIVRSSGGRRPTGEVIEIVERRKVIFSGVVLEDGHIEPDDSSIVYLCRRKTRVKPGTRVFFSFDTNGKMKIHTDLKEGNPLVMINIVKRRFELPDSFPDSVMKEVDTIGQGEPKGRDLRKLITFTIDPEDAKDFDDAISLVRLKNGFRVWIHIADVSRYVKLNSSIDVEALKRGNSTYLMEEVVHMLPEKLSTQICSLQPGKDRNVFSTIIDFTNNFEIKNVSFTKGVINSCARLTYKDALKLINNEFALSDYSTIVRKKKSIADALKIVDDLTIKLKEERIKNGSIEMETLEPEFLTYYTGEILDVRTKERLRTHSIIEELMLLTNKVVAQQLQKKGYPAIYRIHPVPSYEKIENLIKLSSRLLGGRVDGSSAREILSNVLKQGEKTKFSRLLSYLVLRSMTKAKYSSKNEGHFALAFENYLHFTSPIRRYADLMNHRALDALLRRERFSYSNLEDISRHISDTEMESEKAELLLWDMRKAEYLEKRLGEEFKGIVTRIGEEGVLIEIDDILITGMVPVSLIPGKRKRYIEKDEIFKIGRKKIQLGTPVIVIPVEVKKFVPAIKMKIVEIIDG